MADGYWNPQQQPLPQVVPPAGMLKRPRTEFDNPHAALPSGHEMHNYPVPEDDHGEPRSAKDTKTIGSAYDLYLQNAQRSSFTPGGPPSFGGVGMATGSGMPGHPMTNVMGHRPLGTDMPRNGQNIGFFGQHPMDAAGRPPRETMPLPTDASNTLYVEGLPADCKKREVAHIFRPFVGYKEVRLVSKESKHRGGDPLILCFVDFINPACAATAMSALQGYRMDDDDLNSKYLRLQFSRNPGPRSGSGARGKRRIVVHRSVHFNDKMYSKLDIVRPLPTPTLNTRYAPTISK